MKPDQQTVLVRRHSVMTRLTHWINAVCLGFLLLSGLQIFNAWPNLYWGQYGADSDHAFLSIGAARGHGQGYLRIGAATIPTPGVLGVSNVDGQAVERAFPAWLTLPSFQDLAEGRRWHFFFAWCFVLNGAAYLAYNLLNGHLRRDLVPGRGELAPRHLWHEIAGHARLRFPKGEQARHYNVLQKLSYLGVIVLLVLMVLTGLTMSPGMNAVAPFLLDAFGGRQSSRAIHFISASLVVLFVLVHVAMVLLSGVRNNLRSMITGRYAIQENETHHE
jgi:thiosulfate reductase cytochrome b subunit